MVCACTECDTHTYCLSMWYSSVLLGYINGQIYTLSYICLSYFLLFSFSFPFFLFLKGLSHLMMGEQGRSSLSYSASGWMWPWWPMLLPNLGLACRSPPIQSSKTALCSPSPPCLSITFAELWAVWPVLKRMIFVCWQWVDKRKATFKEPPPPRNTVSLHTLYPFINIWHSKFICLVNTAFRSLIHFSEQFSWHDPRFLHFLMALYILRSLQFGICRIKIFKYVWNALFQQVNFGNLRLSCKRTEL